MCEVGEIKKTTLIRRHIDTTDDIKKEGAYNRQPNDEKQKQDPVDSDSCIAAGSSNIKETIPRDY